MAAHFRALMEQEAPNRAPIRILLGPMPEMLRTMIRDLLSCEEDMLVVGESNDPSAALASAVDARADMLIAQSVEDPKDHLFHALMTASPFCIFAIATSGTDATAVQLVRGPISFDASSKAALASAVRKSAHGAAHLARTARSQWLA